MIANIVIVALIAAYCIYLIYKGYKNHKEGKPVGCAVTAVRVADVVEKPYQRRKTERRKAYGKFNRLYVLCIRSILDHLSCRSQHISVGFMDKEMA